MNPQWLLDWAWMGRSHTLLLAATAASRGIAGETVASGPGGIWKWPITEATPTLEPPINKNPPAATAATSVAHRIGQMPNSVYALAVSPNGNALAYVASEGVMVASLDDADLGAGIVIVPAADWPELREIAWEDADEAPTVGRLCDLSWSPDGQYLMLVTWKEGVRIIDVKARRLLPTVATGGKAVYAVWRPSGRG